MESTTQTMETRVNNSDAGERTIQTNATIMDISSKPTALISNTTHIISTSSNSTMLLVNYLTVAIAVIGFSVNLMMWSVMVWFSWFSWFVDEDGCLMWFVMVYDKLLRQNVTNALVCNQTVLDAVASICLLVTTVIKTGGVYITEGFAGTLWCWTMYAGTLQTMAVYCSQAGLVVITLERYFKIVHPIKHRNRFRPWMAHVALILPWLDGIILFLIPSWARTRVAGDRCVKTWPTASDSNIYRLGVFIWQFLLPLFIFGYCYSKIILVIRRQAKTSSTGHLQSVPHPSTFGGVGASHSRMENPQLKQQPTKQQQQHQEQVTQREKNVTKTMLMVTLSYFVCWFPIQVSYQITTFSSTLTTGSTTMNIIAIVAYVNVVLNPIIYCTHFNITQRIIQHLKRRGRAESPGEMNRDDPVRHADQRSSKVMIDSRRQQNPATSMSTVTHLSVQPALVPADVD